MNRNSEVPLVSADAFVMYYDNMLGKWFASGASKSVTIAKVQLLQNLTTNQFRIFAWNPINKEILVTSILYYNLRYQKAHATFHEWRDADTQIVYGLHFADAKEAHIFGDVISKVFSSLESIYQQFRKLQAVIRENVPADQFLDQSSNAATDNQSTHNITSNQLSNEVRTSEYFTNNSTINISQFNQLQKSDFVPFSKTSTSNQINKHSISTGSPLNTNFDFETQDLPNYENINNILLKHSEIKSISTGSDNLELRCLSSSDDSVRGLKRQASSASSGYATVASMVDQYSPTPGLPSSFVMAGEIQNKIICDSKTHVPNFTDYSHVSVHDTSANIEESVQSSFASQLQSLIQLRKQNQSAKSAKIDSVGNLNIRSENNQKSLNSAFESVTNSPSNIDNRFPNNNSTRNKPVDDIMSEMRMKLQRRKQLIDGHTDSNYSSSTEKSDVCNSSASDAGSFVSSNDNFVENNRSMASKCNYNLDGSPTKVQSTDEFQSTKVLNDEDESKSIKVLEEIRDTPSSMIYLKKRSTGDIMQTTTSSSLVLASKFDLDRIKQEISNDFRRELLNVKKEVVNAIRLHQNISS